MNLSKIKEILKTVDVLKFQLPNGSFVPQHFHVTEVGLNTKYFIDCGGTVREEKKVNFQLWEEKVDDHRLAPQKLLKIIEISEKAINLENFEIEIEYKIDTIGKYSLDYKNDSFQLVSTKTACLASDACETEEIKSSDIEDDSSSCCSTSSCC